MLKLKPGNVFQKLNKMDKKQAYTWGAIVVVCFIALITLASFMGDAEDSSFEDFNTRGYDLAQMPFLNDEAEEYLLASKYPDMKDNDSTLLYSSGEKEARQEEDAANAEESTTSAEDFPSSNDVSGGYSSRGYSGRGGRASAPTQVGQLGSANMGRSGGSGVNTTFGAPRGDFSTFKSQDKGTETPMAQLKNQDARRALSQFAQTSRAAAGLRDGKAANAKRALMGGHIDGSEAFTDSGIDLSKATGLAIDPNGDFSSDLSGIGDALEKAANDAKDAKKDFKNELEDKMDPLLNQLFSGLINVGMQGLTSLMNTGIDQMKGAIASNSAMKGQSNNFADQVWNETDWNKLSPDQQAFLESNGIKATDLNGGKTVGELYTYNNTKQSNPSSGTSITVGEDSSSTPSKAPATRDVDPGTPLTTTDSTPSPDTNTTLSDKQQRQQNRAVRKYQRTKAAEQKDFRSEYYQHLKSNTSLEQSKAMFSAGAEARARYVGSSSGTTSPEDNQWMQEREDEFYNSLDPKYKTSQYNQEFVRGCYLYTYTERQVCLNRARI